MWGLKLSSANPLRHLRGHSGGITVRLFGMLFLAVAPLVGFRALELVEERAHLIEGAGSKALEIARHGAELYKEPIVEAQTLLQVAAQVPEVVSGSPEACAAFLEKVERDRGWANGLWVIGTDGRVVCTTVANGVGRDISQRDFFRQALHSRNLVISDFFIERLRGRPTSLALLPVVDAHGRTTRILAASLDLGWFSRLVAGIGSENNARVLLLDGAGTLLARYPDKPDRIGRNFRGAPLMRAIVAGHRTEGWTQVEPVTVGSQRIYGYVQVPGSQARIAVGFNRDKVLEHINGEIAKTALALILTTLFAALAAFNLARGIVRPLRRLIAGAEAARESPTAVLPDIQDYAELASLSTSLKLLLEERAKREAALLTAQDEARSAEQQSRDAHARLTDALNALPEGIAIFDADDRLVLWNRRYDEFYAKAAGNRFVGRHFEDMLRTGIAAGIYADTSRSADEIVQERLARRAKAESSIEQHLAGGRWIRVEERRLADGGIISIHVDITDLKKREAALLVAQEEARHAEQQARDAHSRLAEAIDAVPEAIAIYDAEDRLVLWNRRCDEFYERTAKHRKVGVTFEELYRAGMGLGAYAGISGAGVAGREQSLIEERMAQRGRPDNAHEQRLANGRWLRVEERRIADGGLISIHIDITDLKRREESFRLLFESNPVPMFLYHQDDLRFVAVNDAAVVHYGYSREALRGMTLLDIRPEEDRAKAREFICNNPMMSGQHISCHRKADGTLIEVAIYARPLDYHGGPCGLLAVIDLTERRRAEEQLHRTRTFLDTIIENMPAMVFVKEAREHRYVLMNRAGEQLLGIAREELLGKNAYDLFEESAADLFMASDEEVLESRELQVQEEMPLPTRHNGVRTVSTKKLALTDDQGRPQYLLGISEDITERRQAEARIEHMAHHDALTGLANRLHFRTCLEEALSPVRAGGSGIAVLCADLDYFKDINDVLGHPLGDALLRSVAERLHRCIGETGLVARLGGDEFAIVLIAADDREHVEATAARLIEVIGEPHQVEGHELVVGVSLGIAFAPADGIDGDDLLKKADMALYQAKGDGRGTFRHFEASMEARQQARRSLETDLRQALANDQFELHYQPSIALTTDRIIGCEALLRWRHPERGLISPAEFIPLAEDIGLIVPLGEWVLRQACTEAAGWPGAVRVAVNLSPAQFKSRNLVYAVTKALADSGLAPHRLELEITESVLLREDDANIGILHQLHSLGVRIALDDFGTGYSSLSYLRSFPLDKIKIDRSFVRELPDNSGCRTIIRAIAQLAGGLEMETTAEGVETREQADQVRADGCTEGQGFYFSRPLAAQDIRDVLRGGSGRIERAA